MADCVIEIEGLWTQFGDHVVHRDLNLTVRRGEVVSLVGGSGSGKTTLMRQMLGLEQPAGGGARVRQSLHARRSRKCCTRSASAGACCSRRARCSARCRYSTTSRCRCANCALDEDFIRDMVMLKLDMVDIEPRHATKMPAELSGGMIKRIALARALVLEPELVFLDEPTAGLDPDRSESFVRLIADLQRELDLTVVMVTHDLDTLVALSDRVAVLADQQLIAIGTVLEIAGQTHKFHLQLLPGANAGSARWKRSRIW